MKKVGEGTQTPLGGTETEDMVVGGGWWLLSVDNARSRLLVLRGAFVGRCSNGGSWTDRENCREKDLARGKIQQRKMKTNEAGRGRGERASEVPDVAQVEVIRSRTGETG